MSLQCKRKHRTLILLQKNKILKRREKDDKLVNLANGYSVGMHIHIYTRHRKNSKKIQNFFENKKIRNV